MKNKRGRGGSYVQASPDSERVLVSGTDQAPQAQQPLTAEVKKQSSKSTSKGAAQ